jgi:hypothetical protein
MGEGFRERFAPTLPPNNLLHTQLSNPTPSTPANVKPLSMPQTLAIKQISAMERGWGEAKSEQLKALPPHAVHTLDIVVAQTRAAIYGEPQAADC